MELALQADSKTAEVEVDCSCAWYWGIHIYSVALRILYGNPGAE